MSGNRNATYSQPWTRQLRKERLVDQTLIVIPKDI